MTTKPLLRGVGLVTAFVTGALGTGSAGAMPAGGPPGLALTPPQNVTAEVVERTVELSWDPVAWPNGAKDRVLSVERDGSIVATVPPEAASYTDDAIAPEDSHSYRIIASATFGTHDLSASSALVHVGLPAYLVGAAARDITPGGLVNLGGFGLGDGSFFPEELIGRGNVGGPSGEQIAARAIVVDDGKEAIAIASIETQGMFAAYELGPYGLEDIAAQVAADVPGLPAENILIASDHTHSGPDTIGVWGGVEEEYLQFIKDQTVAAIAEAYADRSFVTITAGHSDASDLIYNQSCSEALNQDKEPTYTGPELCATPGKDGMIRVLQATTPGGDVVATYMAFAAHATAGGGAAIHGDWPQFLSEAMAQRYGGNGIAMVGALGGTQPCRPACAFTSPENPGYDAPDRRTAIVSNYMAHVQAALDSATDVAGPVDARKSYIREPITGPIVAALFTGGKHTGTEIMRSHQNPWVVGNTIRTVVSTLRVGDVLFAGTPGEGFPSIGFGIANALEGEQEVIQLGLANDQLGYLIAPTRYVPVIAAEAAVNDNIIFNVSPTIGDHVMCSDIRLALDLGFEGATPPDCASFDAADAAGDPIAEVPVGGIVLP
ncbi:MAG: hypothetical protein ACRDLB_07815 [Actinomycetota bacterium]